MFQIQSILKKLKEIIQISKHLNHLLRYSYTDKDENLSLNLLTEDEQVVNAGTPEYTRALEGSVSKTFNSDGKMPFRLT